MIDCFYLQIAPFHQKIPREWTLIIGMEILKMVLLDWQDGVASNADKMKRLGKYSNKYHSWFISIGQHLGGMQSRFMKSRSKAIRKAKP